MHRTFAADGTLEERVANVEKYLNDLQLHRDSRRGLEGPKGDKGEPSNVPGPPGKDCDPAEVVKIAQQAMNEELQTAKSLLRQVVVEELRTSGVIDEDGKAVLIPGPAGAPGADSQVAGPPGKNGLDGESIVGPAGRDAKLEIGSVTSGETASASLHENDGVFILDLTLPRGERGQTGADSTVPGRDAKIQIGSVQSGEVAAVTAREDNGTFILDFVLPEGQQGVPGIGLNKHDVISIILDMARRGSLGTKVVHEFPAEAISRDAVIRLIEERMKQAGT